MNCEGLYILESCTHNTLLQEFWNYLFVTINTQLRIFGSQSQTKSTTMC